jgi:hypothetical protein
LFRYKVSSSAEAAADASPEIRLQYDILLPVVRPAVENAIDGVSKSNHDAAY